MTRHQRMPRGERREVPQDIKSAYPGTEWLKFRVSTAWAGLLSVPIAATLDEDDAPLILHDLDYDRTVAIADGGHLTHSERCPIPRDRHPELLDGLRIPKTPHTIRLLLPAARNGPSGYPVHPRARVVGPEMSPQLYQHGHFWTDPRSGEYWVCPLGAHLTPWTWDSGGLLYFIDQVTYWAVKTKIWAATRDGTAGRWLGAEAGHDPVEILRDAPPDGPCPCGGGQRFRDCHRSRKRPDVIRQSVMEVLR